MPTFQVAAMARRHVTVVLSGDGGVEACGGYSFRFMPHAAVGVARRCVRGAAGRRLAAWCGERWPRSPRVPRLLRWGTQLENVSRDPATAYYSDLCQTKPHHTRRLLGLPVLRDLTRSRVYDEVTEPYRRCASSSAVQRAQYADLKLYLANDVLVKVDRMTMQHGLEVRCPLLDHRVVELAFRIPRRRKMPLLRPKYLLRQLARKRLPPQLANLPKHGFSAPVGEWIAGAHAAMFDADVLAPAAKVRTLLDMSYVRALVDEHRGRRADHSTSLWTVWMLARWMQHAL
jgi:asparagine synthase (glutamine-hydrolysing)